MLHALHHTSWCIVQQRSIAERSGGRNSPHLLLLQVDHDLGRPQRNLLHEMQVLVPAASGKDISCAISRQMRRTYQMTVSFVTHSVLQVLMMTGPMWTCKSSVAEQQRRAPDQLAGQVQEGLLVVVVGLGADLVVLQVLLAVEGHLAEGSTSNKVSHTRKRDPDATSRWAQQQAPSVCTPATLLHKYCLDGAIHNTQWEHITCACHSLA